MSIKYREYNNYGEYIVHQSEKLNIKLKKRTDVTLFEKRVKIFIKKFKYLNSYLHGQDILCLGARRGEEVVAFRRIGFEKTFGIDLNPGPDNNYVITKDFHNTGFEDVSFDIIYSNAIDHSFDLEKLSKEIHRIIKSDGFVILDISHLTKDCSSVITSSSKYESVIWDSLDDIKSLFEKNFEFLNIDNNKVNKEQVTMILRKK